MQVSANSGSVPIDGTPGDFNSKGGPPRLLGLGPTVLPVARMLERTRLAKEESDTAYFFDLLYTGEMLLKLLVAELVAGVEDDRDRHRYSAEYRLIRADGIGEWVDVLDELLTGPTSQHLVAASRESQRALSTAFGPASGTWQRDAVVALGDACRSIDSEQLDYSQRRVSIRDWARQFAWLRNRTRGHGCPRSATLSSVSPALWKSLESVIGGAPALLRDWAFLHRNLSGKYRVSSIGGSRTPFEHLAVERDHSLEDGVYVDLGGLRRVPLLYTDADLTDFLFPNGNYRSTRIELLSYVTDETRTEDAAAWSQAANSQPRSETKAFTSLDVVGDVFTNMPPKREGYVGRRVLEEELLAVLLDNRYPVITLKGRGGVGKTSLALEVLHELTARQEYFAIVWFSARDIDLLADGPKVVRADVLTTTDVARDFAELSGVASLLRGPAAAQEYLTQCLSGAAEFGPFLFVFDNFETMREQADLYAYLNNAVRLPNKVLITTRTRDFKADYPIEVGGMTAAEYSNLVEDVAERLGVSSLVDHEYLGQLYEESDGHPYITKVLLGEVAKAGRQVSLKRVIATKDALLDALFDRSFAGLSPAGQRVFLTLCSWRSHVPRIGLEAVLLRPGNDRMDVDEALLELQKSSLVEEVLDSESATTFLSVPLAAALFGKRKLVTSVLKIAIEADLQLVMGFGPTTAAEVSLGLGPRLDRLTRAIASRLGQGDDSQEVAIIEYIASDYPPAWLHLASLQQEQADTAGARASVSRYLESAPTDESAWRRLIALSRQAADPIGEMHGRLQLAELGLPDYRELSGSASRLNGMLSRKEIELDADERRLMVRKLRHLMESRVSEADATDLSRLAWLCMHDQDTQAAVLWARTGLETEPENEHCLKLIQRAPGTVQDDPPE